MEKHYNKQYLEATYNLAEEIKLKSYEYFKNINEGTIVDLGCGTGQDVINLTKVCNAKAIGIDHDKNMIESAKKNAIKHNINIDFKVAHAEKIPLGNDSIEGIRAERIFQHLKDQNKVLKEINRCLSPNGKLVIIETDWAGLTIFNQYPKLISKVQDYLTHQKINNGLSTRSLFLDLESNSFKVNSVKVYPLVVSSLSLANQFFMIDKIIDEMHEQNLLTLSEKKILTKNLDELNKKGIFQLTINMLVFYASKK